ncbi:hypothetical protein K493DRAFT_333201 [Basidiobolus meristosporus CBS 931.73]|uniref:PAS domain-containing protein n=1 Tax=Basidiobolus meristosporus CBS 931.73 TaxID=1314790 RepID=A0A1Y1Z8I5_9FUNG|nr:hypothetical protein K493DRAFT_333201 [Basidiobolus meristosporus CBS 931.73]|eukprot:ORY06317.1 hypothetical protein K493DRAFT_333201 [Basidiobolus meristosporus CBS 931.73]
MSRTSFISIASVDSTRMLYLSESCKDVLGFSGQQWVGQSANHWFHPEDRGGLGLVIQTCAELQKIATLIYTRVLSADGYVLLEASFNYCYDIIVSSNRLLKEDDYNALFAEDIITILNAKDIHVLGNPNIFCSSRELRQVLSLTDSLPPNSPLEQRVCIVVNHNVEDYTIEYCSALATEILGTSPEELIGTSFFEYVQYGSMAEVREELRDIVAEQSVGNKIEFTWISKTFQQVELEAIITHTDDGLIFISRILDHNDFFLPILEAFQ